MGAGLIIWETRTKVPNLPQGNRTNIVYSHRNNSSPLIHLHHSCILAEFPLIHIVGLFRPVYSQDFPRRGGGVLIIRGKSGP